MKKAVIMSLICLIFGNVYAMEFLPALDINGGIAYPTIVTGESSELDKKIGAEAGLAGSFMVNTDLLPQLWFIPTLTANYSSTAQPLYVDDQRFIFSQWLDAYLSVGFNYQLSDNWEMRMRALTRFDYSQQTADEVLGKGLYDYYDRGVYFENAVKFGEETPAEITAGFKYIDKRFPNYASLSSQIDPDTIGGTQNAVAKNEKDNLSYSAYIFCDLQLGNSGWFPSMGFTYDYVRYYDQRIIGLDGTLGGMNRIDRLAVVDLDFPFYAADASGVNLAYMLSISTVTQNYYDSLGNMDPSDDVFTEGYYNYLSHALNARFTYELGSVFLNSYKPTLNVGVAVETIAYTKRFAKDVQGNYTAAKQLDFNITPSVEYRHKLTDFWNYYLNIILARYNSNMKWEAYGTFNYTLLTISAGTALSF